MEFYEFVTKPKELGGMGFVLPGDKYEEMKSLQNRAWDDNKKSYYPYKDYFKVIQEMSMSHKYKELQSKIKSSIVVEAAIPKVAYAIDSYDRLNGRQLAFLIKAGCG